MVVGAFLGCQLQTKPDRLYSQRNVQIVPDASVDVLDVSEVSLCLRMTEFATYMFTFKNKITYISQIFNLWEINWTSGNKVGELHAGTLIRKITLH